MNDTIYLRPNHNNFNIVNILLGGGKYLGNYVFKPGEIWFDDKGCIRQFSMEFSDGSIGNFILTNLSQNRSKITDTVLKDISSFGIQFVGNMIFQDGGIAMNLAKFLFKKYGKIAITDVLTQKTDDEFGYVEINDQSLVIKGVLTLADGEYTNAIMVKLFNYLDFDVLYETSRDNYNWRQWKLQAKSSEEWFFGNNQTSGHLRIFTNNYGYRSFTIFSGIKYIIDIDNSNNTIALFKE